MSIATLNGRFITRRRGGGHLNSRSEANRSSEGATVRDDGEDGASARRAYRVRLSLAEQQSGCRYREANRSHYENKE